MSRVQKINSIQVIFKKFKSQEEKKVIRILDKIEKNIHTVITNTLVIFFSSYNNR